MLNPLVRALGAATTLEVVRRRTGETQRIPVNVLESGGRRYLVSARGETEWVRNLRASSHCTLRRRGRQAGYRATELPISERPAVIAEYRARWDSQVRRFFEQLPEPAAHPVFRLEPAD